MFLAPDKPANNRRSSEAASGEFRVRTRDREENANEGHQSLFHCALASLSAIVFALAVPSATAQELHGHNVCREVGAFTPEQLGDREGHALSIGQSSCQTTEGPGAGAVQTETNMWEWDGPKAKELSGYGVARKPGATFAFQHTDGTLEVTMTDGKPSGWTASGHGIVTLATGSLASLNGKKYEWTGKGTGPNVFEGDYTFK